MRKVFLDDLPHSKSGKTIKWSECIGKTLEFEYEKYNGCFTITGYNKETQKVELEYLDKKYELQAHNLPKGNIAKLFNVCYGRRKEYKYEIGEITKSGFKVIERFYANGKHNYKCECINCHDVVSRSEYGMENGCKVCLKLKINPKINGLKNQRPDIYSIIIDKNINNLGCGSKRKVYWKCPHCNNINYTSVAYLTKDKYLPCKYCGDGFSYGEKILYGVFAQLVDEYEHHIKFDWSQGKEYDLHYKGIIVEIHGSQHYSTAFDYCGGRSLAEERENDIYKEYLAKENYKNLIDYIVIPSDKTDFSYIKNNILQSDLHKYFDLSVINWEKVKNDATQPSVFEICRLYNDGYSLKEISRQIGKSWSFVYNKVKQGEELKLCKFVANPKYIQKQVKCKNTSKIFNSIKEASEWCGLKSATSITNCCNGKKKSAGKHPITNEKLVWEFV